MLRFRNEFFNFLKASYPELEDSITSSGALDDKGEEQIKKAVKEFKGIFKV